MYSPQNPSDICHSQSSTVSAADYLAAFALAKLIARNKHGAIDPQLALALAFAICARLQGRSIELYVNLASTSWRKLGVDLDAFVVKNFGFSEGDFAGLLKWDVPQHKLSERDQELEEAFIAACKNCTLPQAYKIPLPEDMERLRKQDESKMLEIALHKYAKQKNMLTAELEIVEVKERGLFIECQKEYGYECQKEYGHYNFLVKNSDGTSTLFFAEVDIECKGEENVYLCCPLEENDNGNCFGCRWWDVELRHPTSAGYLGGHKDTCGPYTEISDDYECIM